MRTFRQSCRVATIASLIFLTFHASAQPSTSAADGGTPSQKNGSATPAEGAKDIEDLLAQPSTEHVGRVLGYRIQQHEVQIYTHGTLATDWTWTQGRPNTFRLREAHVYVGANIYDVLQPEIFIQYEQTATSTSPLRLRYAQVDYKLMRGLIVARGGLFLIPFGIYNTTLFNRYVAKFVDRPLIHGQIVPTTWSEVGVQLYGRWEWAEGRGISYSAYVTNGLIQDPTRAGTYDNAWTATQGFKTVGARVGVDLILGLGVGLSAYRGGHDATRDTWLELLGLDLLYRRGPLSVEGEFMYGAIETPGSSDTTRKGLYLAAGYKVVPALEPVIGFETSPPTQSGVTNRALVGFNYIPMPEKFPTAMLKANYGRRNTGIESVIVEFVLGY